MAENIDSELLAELKKALRKRRNYAIVAKGPLVLKLIVQKKPIKPGVVREAKRTFGGKQIIAGTCFGEGGKEIVFQLEGKEPSITESRFRKFISDQTGLVVQPRFEVVEELE